MAPVGLHQEVQSDLVEAREEVESEPGTLSGTSWPGVTWCTPGSDREDLESVGLEKMVGVGDGRTLIETSSVGSAGVTRGIFLKYSHHYNILNRNIFTSLDLIHNTLKSSGERWIPPSRGDSALR